MKGFRNGSKLYQQRAQRALPLLVARAKSWGTFTYGQLAEKLNMQNPRNLNYVLGAVGQELKRLSRDWKEEVPPIECIVINKNNKTPGRGIGFHMPVEEFKMLTPAARKQVLRDLNLRIWGYPKWDAVLSHFNLSPAMPDRDVLDLVQRAAYGRPGGESPEHKALKEYIAENPHILGLGKVPPSIEHRFGSGDEVDVLLKYPKEWVGIEVKAINSDELDLARGIFQCVKYEALIRAEQKLQHETVGVRVIFVLAGSLPVKLRELADILEVEVRERVAAPARFAAKRQNSIAAGA